METVWCLHHTFVHIIAALLEQHFKQWFFCHFTPEIANRMNVFVDVMANIVTNGIVENKSTIDAVVKGKERSLQMEII